MIDALKRPRPTYRLASGARTFELLSGAVLRYGLVFFLVGIGLLKFTPAEALGIQPMVAHSPFMSWLYALTNVQAATDLIGIVELTLGGLLVVRHWWPKLSVVGSLGASVQFLITLSFLFTTPDLSPDMQGFLMKDLMLFGAALWTAGDALRAVRPAR